VAHRPDTPLRAAEGHDVTLAAAEEILAAIDAAATGVTELEAQSADLRLRAVDYARARVDWMLAEPAARRRMDAARSGAHDRFIFACDDLASACAAHQRDSSWRVAVGADRRAIGDFACLVHAWMGLWAR
jgi:hypothetical protein